MSGQQFPPLERVATLVDRFDKVRTYVEPNVRIWKTIHGALRTALDLRVEFDPWTDYWNLPERRVLVAYFADRFRGMCAPTNAMRRLALHAFREYQRARDDGAFGPPALPSKHPLPWTELRSKLTAEAHRLGAQEEYAALKAVWPALSANSLRAHFEQFLNWAGGSNKVSDIESTFINRLPWFAYLGTDGLEQLRRRQLFLGSFYLLWGSTNSFKHGGAMGFAPILQNNPSLALLEFAERWGKGESPDETRFVTRGKDSEKDRSSYTQVIELFGFLNLHTQPFYNGKATAYDSFAETTDESVYPRLRRIGVKTRDFLKSKPALIDRLTALMDRLAGEVSLGGISLMESIKGKRVPKSRPEDVKDLVDAELDHRIELAARARYSTIDREGRAAMCLHLLLDSVVYGKHPLDNGPAVEVHGDIRLPDALKATANDALALLRAGHHVLFAGAPGTGKTTLAQIVGHAWNNDQRDVSASISFADAPVTTVGNSAWAPFHTIGGILPDGNGRFVPQKGIFVGEELDRGEWQLRDQCVVLDEMNRADLDRCIGELYPLLSHSVSSVEPAGIPGVKRIRAHPRFRIIATVNDQTLDDIVFPISEGLARRFIRIELEGALATEIREYVKTRATTEHAERVEAAAAAVDDFFDACREAKKLRASELGERLPFGVGYFALLARWAADELRMSGEFGSRDLTDQAYDILRMSLASAARAQGIEQLLAQLGTSDETE